MKKKYLICIISLIVTIIATLNISMGIYANKYTTYVAKVTSKNMIENVIINNTSIQLDRYVNDDVQITSKKNSDGEEKIYLTSQKEGNITIQTSVIDNVCIKYEKDKDNIEVYKDGNLQTLEDGLYTRHSNVLQDVAQSLSRYSIIIFLVLLPIITLLVVCIEKVLKKLKENTVKFYDILLLIISVFLIFALSFYICLYALRGYIVIPIIVLISLGVWYLKDTAKENIQNIYVFIATAAGILMLFLIPPFNVPDEGAHFIKSYESSYINNDDEGIAHLPISIENFFFKYVQGSTTYNIKYNGKNYMSDMFEKGDYNNLSTNTKSYTNTKYSSIIPYLPSVITIFIGRILNLSPLFLSLLGRFANLLITIACCYIALKNVPHFKKVIFIVALFPMFLHQAAAVNMDWLTNLMSLLIVSFILKYKYIDRILNKKDYVLLFSMAILLAFCKFGYFPILFLILIIPNDKFKSKREAIIFKILFILLPFIISFMQNSSLGGALGGNTKNYYTISYAIKHPIQVISIYWETLQDNFPLHILRGMFDGFGTATQWHRSLQLQLLTILYVIFIAIAGNGEEKIKVFDRCVIVAVALMIVFVIYSALFFTWTPIGSYTVNGLQPRYFIPAAMLIILALSNNVIKLESKNRNLIFSFSMCVIYLLTFFTVGMGFY